MNIKRLLHYIVFDLPDDVVVVLAGLFAGVVYLWMSINNVYTVWDVFCMLITVTGLIGFPLVYSIHCSYIRKHDFIICFLTMGGWYPG